MPYIEQKRRNLYDKLISKLAKKIVKVNVDNADLFCGDLNYIITKLLVSVYYKENPCSIRYNDHNEIIGMLECCKNEWYRKLTAPYEDEKITKNGSVKS